MAQRGPIEPNLKSLSQGDALEQVEKFGGRTTPFRGQNGQKRGEHMSLFFPEYFLFFLKPFPKAEDFGPVICCK